MAKRKRNALVFKARMGLEALRVEQTVAEPATRLDAIRR